MPSMQTGCGSDEAMLRILEGGRRRRKALAPAAEHAGSRLHAVPIPQADCLALRPSGFRHRHVFYNHWIRSAGHVVANRQFWSSGDMERRLAAIVCADVAGYSRMMGADEAGTHAAFKAHRSAIYPIILNHGGRLVKNTGDGFLLEFPSIVGAIESAIEMQALMAERNDQLPADRVMQFRIGVHMGDVIADEDEVFGDDVNIAVRLESVASPGGVAVSDKAYREAGKHLNAPLVNAGIHRLKNIGELVNIWTWEPAGYEAEVSAKASDLPA